ncbi:hypothetical protein JTB14_001225 [Gonioctena quinquepunctata]|nr:hypothetical protein JTB14_001225 [Gonioctena quinquepunctata]
MSANQCQQTNQQTNQLNNSNARPGTSNEGKPVTESWNKINSTSMQMPNFQRSDLVPQEKMAHLKQIPQMATYGQIAAKTIVNNPNSGPITYDNPNNKDNFVEVTYRKQNKQNRVYKKNIGTGPSDDISEFSGPERKVWLYLYRVKRAATEEKIKDYITKKPGYINGVCVKEIPTTEDRLRRYVVTAPLSKKDEMYKPDFWPSRAKKHTKHKTISTKLIETKDDLDLAYASYEPTKSFSKENPEPTPLLILHGLMASKNNWNSFCKKCHEQTKSKVIAIDARNHGDSPHTREHSYDDLVMDVRQFMYKMDLKKINLLGHSMGGRTAMLFALKYPKLVEKLIVADISPITSSPSFKQLPKLMTILKRIEIPEKISLYEARKLVGENLYSLIGNKRLISFFITNLVQNAGGSYSWRFNAKALAESFQHILTFPEIYNINYVGPVLFIGGAKSDYIQ